MKTNFKANKRALSSAGAAIIIVVLLVGAMFASYGMTGSFFFGIDNNSGGTIIPGETPGSNTVIPAGSWSGPLYLSVVDKVGGAAFTTSTVTVDQVAAVNGVFDFISGPSKSVTQAANPQSAVRVWNEGDEVIVMPDCTGNPSNGLDYYPAMYYMKLSHGATIYELSNINCFRLVSTSPYKYQIDTSFATALPQKVAEYTASNVQYWNIGDLGLYPRQAAADFDMYLTYNGATLASVTDASTWVDTATEITANATLASVSNEKLTFQMVGANANLGWGKHFFAFNGQGKISEYGATITMTTSMVGVGTGALVGEGWVPISTSTLYAEKGFFKVLEPAFPTKGQKAGWSVNIPIDSTAATAATEYKVSIWVNDCQNLDNLASVGPTSAYPTAYGFVTAYGVGAILQTPVLTYSSGAGATMQLMAYVTTPS